MLRIDILNPFACWTDKDDLWNHSELKSLMNNHANSIEGSRIQDGRKLKHPNYSITQWFDSKNIEYSISNDPDWIVIHVMSGGYLLHNQNMLDLLSDNIKKKLRTGRTGLLFWYPYETENYREENIRSQISGLNGAGHNDCLIKVLVTGNLNNKDIVADTQKQVSLALRKVNPKMHGETPSLSKFMWNNMVNSPNITVVPLLFFDWQLITHLKQVGDTGDIIDEDFYNWNKSKSFMCLNGKDKHHRRLMLRQIRGRKLESQGHISYVCSGFGRVKIEGNVDSTLNVNEWLNEVPIFLDQQPHETKSNDRWMNPEIYNDAWINVVTEAFPFIEQDLFITEKTFKPMLQLQPFLIQGNRYTLKKLREFGFKTFPTLFDESYDELLTVEERTEAIGNELSKWCEETHKKEMIKSVWDDLLHNQQMLFNTESSLTRSACLAEILKSVSVGG